MIANHNCDCRSPASLHLRGTWFEIIKLIGQKCPFGDIGGYLRSAQALKKTSIGAFVVSYQVEDMLILTWGKVSLILSRWDCSFFPLNWLGKWEGGLEAQRERVGTSLGEVESWIHSLSLGSSTSFYGIEVIKEGSTSPLWEKGRENDGEGDSFLFYSPTWVSTFFPDRREITVFTFRTS